MSWIMIVLQFFGLFAGTDQAPQCYIVDDRGTRIHIEVSVDETSGMYFTVLHNSALGKELHCTGFETTTISQVTDLQPIEFIDHMRYQKPIKKH